MTPNVAANVDPHWWAQPLATVAAAIIALVAAGIAWHGVTSQSREANRRDRITNRIGVLADIHAAALHVLQEGVRVRLVENSAENRQTYTLAVASTMVDKTRLTALGGYNTVVQAAEDVLKAVFELTNSTDEIPSTEDASEKLAILGDVIAEAVQKEDGKRR